MHRFCACYTCRSAITCAPEDEPNTLCIRLGVHLTMGYVNPCVQQWNFMQRQSICLCGGFTGIGMAITWMEERATGCRVQRWQSDVDVLTPLHDGRTGLVSQRWQTASCWNPQLARHTTVHCARLNTASVVFGSYAQAVHVCD